MRRALFVLMLVPVVAACDNSYSRLDIAPVSATDYSRFVGAIDDIRVEFVNESGRADVDVFPEPPLTIRSQDSQQICKADGGIWVRKSAHINTDRKLLLLQEYSGSNDSLVFYDTATCAIKLSLDISGARWEIQGGQLQVGRECAEEGIGSCKKIDRYVFDRSGLPNQQQ